MFSSFFAFAVRTYAICGIAGFWFYAPEIASSAFAAAANLEQQKYIVDGLSLGGTVYVQSKTYKEYDCRHSNQFRGFTFCQKKKSDDSPRGSVSSTTTIIHADDNSVAYVNRFIDPAYLTSKEISEEISRLSTKFGQQAQLLVASSRPGIPKATIATWGTLRLKPLEPGDRAIARSGHSPGKGILVDFLEDFTNSAQLDLPIYTIEGGNGFVWSASYDDQGRGKLRFFAINAAALSAARTNLESSVQPSVPVRNDAKTEAPKVSCDASCTQEAEEAVELLSVCLKCPMKQYKSELIQVGDSDLPTFVHEINKWSGSTSKLRIDSDTVYGDMPIGAASDVANFSDLESADTGIDKDSEPRMSTVTIYCAKKLKCIRLESGKPEFWTSSDHVVFHVCDQEIASDAKLAINALIKFNKGRTPRP